MYPGSSQVIPEVVLLLIFRKEGLGSVVGVGSVEPVNKDSKIVSYSVSSCLLVGKDSAVLGIRKRVL